MMTNFDLKNTEAYLDKQTKICSKRLNSIHYTYDPSLKQKMKSYDFKIKQNYANIQFIYGFLCLGLFSGKFLVLSGH